MFILQKKSGGPPPLGNRVKSSWIVTFCCSVTFFSFDSQTSHFVQPHILSIFHCLLAVFGSSWSVRLPSKTNVGEISGDRVQLICLLSCFATSQLWIKLIMHSPRFFTTYHSFSPKVTNKFLSISVNITCSILFKCCKLSVFVFYVAKFELELL